MRCPICKGKDHIHLVHKFERETPIGKIFKCNCGFIFKKREKIFYDTDYLYFNPKRELVGKHLARQDLKIVRKYIKKGKLLDVGCGRGYFLAEAKKVYEAYGCEISQIASEYATKYNKVKVFNVPFESFKKDSYDIITMWDFIEHVNNPVSMLKKAYSMLSDNGILIIDTPNIGSFYYKLIKKYWVSFVYYHVNFFSKDTLSRLIEKAGFKRYTIKTKNFNLFSLEGLWRLGLINMIKKKEDSIENLQFKAEIIDEIIFRWLKYTINFPLNFIFNKLKLGDSLLLIARKKCLR